MRILLLALAAAGIAIGGSAIAQTDAPPQGQMPPPPGHGMRGMGGLMAADANHDGIITRQEAIAAADRRFDAIDTDRDGKISPDEMSAYRQEMATRRGGDMPVRPPGGPRHALGMGRKADPNGDGVVTRDEYRARQLERFDRMDANHDGRIDQTEIANMRELRQVDRREQGQTPPPPAQQ